MRHLRRHLTTTSLINPSLPGLGYDGLISDVGIYGVVMPIVVPS